MTLLLTSFRQRPKVRPAQKGESKADDRRGLVGLGVRGVLDRVLILGWTTGVHLRVLHPDSCGHGHVAYGVDDVDSRELKVVFHMKRASATLTACREKTRASAARVVKSGFSLPTLPIKTP